MKYPFFGAVLLALSTTFAQAEQHMMEVVAGDLNLSGAFTRATLPNAPVAGGFVEITNNGPADDRLIAAVSPISLETQIHEMAMDGDVMKMRELPDGLVIPAGETVSLKPGGYHVMFMDLTGPLLEGETITMRLFFETAGEVDLTLPVGPTNAGAMGTMMHSAPAASE